MSLCILCQSLPLLSPPHLPPSQDLFPVPPRAYPSLVSILNSRIAHLPASQRACETVEPLGLPFHQSLESLNEAAASGCAICEVVERDVAQFRKEFEESKGDEMWRRGRAGGERDIAGPAWRMWVARGVNDTGGFMVLSVDGIRKYEAWVVSAVGLCVEYDDALGAIIRGRKVGDGQRALTHALGWVSECDKNRTGSRCHVDDAALPSRVLDVRSDLASGVALHESNGETGRYAALSHVWGDTNPFTTTKANVEAHKKGLDVEKLPKTFSDAIRVTRELGIRYLWIDALCICQDDEEDWSREASKMSSVYSNAYIMLSATGSASDSYGLSLFSDDQPTHTYSSFPYTSEGITGTIHAFPASREVASFRGNYALLSDEPLSQRGWALQERLLAPRILHFSSNQRIFFECYCHFLTSDGFKMQGRIDSIFPGSEPDWFKEKTEGLSHGPLVWHGVLSQYCRRKLSKSTDKLPALSGLARTLEEQTGDTYVAGLWRKSLIEGLIWQAIGTTTAVNEYRAPSWSWASIDGPFGMFCLGVGPDVGEWTALGTVLDCQITLKTENPYGEVSDGYLKIRAPLELLAPGEKEVVEGFPDRQKGPRMRTRCGSKEGTGACFDTPAHAEMARGKEILVLLLAKHARTVGGTSAYHGIIVTPVEGKEETYRRLGKIPFGHEGIGECDWMSDESKMVTVTLV